MARSAEDCALLDAMIGFPESRRLHTRRGGARARYRKARSLRGLRLAYAPESPNGGRGERSAGPRRAICAMLPGGTRGNEFNLSTGATLSRGEAWWAIISTA